MHKNLLWGGLGYCSLLITLTVLLFVSAVEAKTYTRKDPKFGGSTPYTQQQKERLRIIDKKKYTTCRLMKRVKSRHTGRQACIYKGGNKTYTLMYEQNCPKQYQCVYNPGGTEPNIDDVIDSLNSIKK